MTLNDPVRVRLTFEKQALYEANAAALNMTLGSYLRKRLEQSDNMLEEVVNLKKSLESLEDLIFSLKEEIQENRLVNTDNTSAKQSNNGDLAMFLEIILLLRQIAGPQRMTFAQSEVKRLGLKIWQGE